MPRLLRTFIAFRLSSSLRARFMRTAETLKTLDPNLRTPQADDLHLTLQFLGETPEEDVHAIHGAMTEVAETTPPLFLAFSGLGAFPEPSRARAVWAGVQDLDVDVLEGLVARLRTALENVGYPPERRRFTPHITLGRLRRTPAPELVSHLTGGPETGWGTETLSEMKLILSDPRNKPYHYIDLTTVPLMGDPEEDL